MKKRIDKEPPLNNFSDFREYLNAYFHWRKYQDPTWSFRVWARSLGLRSCGNLCTILKGGRNPGPRLVEQLIHALKLKPQAASHFRILVAKTKMQRGQDRYYTRKDEITSEITVKLPLHR